MLKNNNCSSLSIDDIGKTAETTDRLCLSRGRVKGEIDARNYPVSCFIFFFRILWIMMVDDSIFFSSILNNIFAVFYSNTICTFFY